MKPPFWLPAAAVLALGLAGCGDRHAAGSGHDDEHEHEHEHGEDDHEAESGVSYAEGRGLRLSPEVIAALGVRPARAELRPLAEEVVLTAQVVALKPVPQACASLPASRAEALRDATVAGARIVRIDAAAAAANRRVDVILELDPAAVPVAQPGDFVPLVARRPAGPALVVPRSAVLDGAAGSFVYVVDGDAYRRTPVTVGAEADGLIAIHSGLGDGDTVVAAPVDQLWLAELRLTKGGGHSH